MDEFLKTNGLVSKNVCFMLNGKELSESDTPDLIGMKQGDNIDAYERLHLFS